MDHDYVMDSICDTFFTDYFWDRNMDEYREKWVDEDHDLSVDFGNWFLDMVEEEMHLFVQENLRSGNEMNEKLWDLLVKYGMTNAYRLYKETKGEINNDTSDVDIITCILMTQATNEVPNWMEQMEETFVNEANEDESEANALFKNKHPNAACRRCDEKLNDHLYAVMCGGRGGACKTWYCASCHEDGTDDCGCESEEEDE